MTGFFPYTSIKTFQLGSGATVDQVVTFQAPSPLYFKLFMINLATGSSYGRTFNLRIVGEQDWIFYSDVNVATICGSTFPYEFQEYLIVTPSKGIEFKITDTLSTATVVNVLFQGLQIIESEAA
jgi:hypothetical protein